MKEPGRVAYNDPLAFFLTWTTYGTWLPGDERGWMEKPGRFHTCDVVREMVARTRMAEDACVLSSDQRRIVERTIDEHCRVRNWRLHAVNCRSNHVHVVVAAEVAPERVMEQFKAWCTRRLKETTTARKQTPRRQWWTERGSKRYINNMDDLEAAIQYVLEGQDRNRGS